MLDAALTKRHLKNFIYEYNTRKDIPLPTAMVVRISMCLLCEMPPGLICTRPLFSKHLLKCIRQKQVVLGPPACGNSLLKADRMIKSSLVSANNNLCAICHLGT